MPSAALNKKRGLAPAIRRLHLRHPNLTGGQIARRVGCSRQNVHQVLTAFLDGYSEQELRDFQAKKADIYDAIQLRILESLTDKKIQKSSVRALVLAFAILHDKSQLLRDKSTVTNVTALLDVADAIRRRNRNAGD